MSNWFYYDENGTKVGPVQSGDLKQLAGSGVIQPETVIESETGQKAYAKNTKGLFNVTEPATKKMEPAPTAAPENSPHAATKPSHWFYYTNDGKKTGPVSGRELKFLADTGVIAMGTILESDTGVQTIAKNVPVLFNSSQTIPSPPLPESQSESVVPSQPESAAAPKTETDVHWYYLDADGNKFGPVTMFQLELLAENGAITPKTILKSKSGEEIYAMRVINFGAKEVNWYYYGANNQKLGPVSFAKLQTRVAEGIVTSTTILESEDGKRPIAQYVLDCETVSNTKPISETKKLPSFLALLSGFWALLSFIGFIVVFWVFVTLPTEVRLAIGGNWLNFYFVLALLYPAFLLLVAAIGETLAKLNDKTVPDFDKRLKRIEEMLQRLQNEMFRQLQNEITKPENK